MPRRATLERIASTMRWAFSPLSSRVFVASTRAKTRPLAGWTACRSAQLDRRVVAGDDHRGIEVADPLPLPQKLLALGPEILGEVHPIEVLRQGPDAVRGD